MLWSTSSGVLSHAVERAGGEVPEEALPLRRLPQTQVSSFLWCPACSSHRKPRVLWPRSQCAKSAWMSLVLHDGLGFPRRSTHLTTTAEIRRHNVHWSLGALLYLTRYLPLRLVPCFLCVSLTSQPSPLPLQGDTAATASPAPERVPLCLVHLPQPRLLPHRVFLHPPLSGGHCRGPHPPRLSSPATSHHQLLLLWPLQEECSR